MVSKKQTTHQRRTPAGGKSKGTHAVRHVGGDANPSLAGRLRFVRKAGLQYKGLRDIFAAAGYVTEGSENFDHYWSLYERDPVAGRVVDMPAKTTWRTPPLVFEGEEPPNTGETPRPATDFETQWEALTKRLRLWSVFERVDRLARVGQYATLLIGARGADDVALKQPLTGLAGPEQILYCIPFAEKYAAIETWERNTNDPRFGLPLTYQVQFSAGVSGFPELKARVHQSRLIHVAEDALVDEVFGRPALKRALNALTDLLKVSAATGEAYWQIASKILTAKIDSDLDLGKDPTNFLKGMGESMEEMVHDLRRQFVGHGVELGWLDTTVPTPGDALELYKALVAVATGIPTRVLFGSERGELASTQDERNYFGMVNERQEHFAEPNILRAFIDRLCTVGALPMPKEGPGQYTVQWPSLFELTEKEQAEANKARAEAAKALTAMGGDPMSLVEVDEDGNVWLLPTEGGEDAGGRALEAGAAGEGGDLEAGPAAGEEEVEDEDKGEPPPIDDEEEPE